MNANVVFWPTIIGVTGAYLAIETFFWIQGLLSTNMAFMLAVIVAILYFGLIWRITRIKVRRVLLYKRSFWGPKLCRGYTYWRIGLGRGFLEISGSCAGLYLPQKDAQEGKPR